MKRSFIFFVCLLIPFVLLPQWRTGNLIGTVVDTEGNPLPGVVVTLGQATVAPMTTRTDAEGKFRFLHRFPANDYIIKAELPGFKTKTQTGIIVNAGTDSDITIRLEKAKIIPVEVKAKDKLGVSPSDWAVASGDKDLADLLIAEGADVKAKNTDGYTPLILASKGNHVDVVDLLKKYGARE